MIHCSFLVLNLTKESQHLCSLTQTRFMKESVLKFGISDHNPVSTPLDPKTMGDRNSRPLEDANLYQSMVGVLTFIANSTHPDISFAVSFLARSCANPCNANIKRAVRVLKYLDCTADLGLPIYSLPLNTLNIVQMYWMHHGIAITKKVRRDVWFSLGKRC